MKNIFSRLAAVLSISCLFALTAQSALAQSSPQIFLPEDLTLGIHVQSENNPELFEKIFNLIDLSLQSEDAPLHADFVLDNLREKQFAFGISNSATDDDGNIFLAFPVSQSKFIDFIEQAMTTGEYTESTVGFGNQYYVDQSDFYFTYKLGNFIATNSEASISERASDNTLDSILGNEKYQNYQNNYQDSQYFIDLAIFPNALFSDENTFSDFELINFEGLNFSRSNNGISGQVYVEFADNQQFNQPSFSPLLFKEINPEKLILLSESYNLDLVYNQQLEILADQPIYSELLNELENTTADYTSVLEDELGIELGAEILSEMQKRTALAVHRPNPDQLFPYFSVYFEIDPDSQLDQLITAAVEDFNRTQQSQNIINTPDEVSFETFDIEEIQISQIQFNGSTLTKLSPLQNPSDTASPELEIPSIIYGFTDSNHFILTTHPNPDQIIGSVGLDTIPELQNKLRFGNDTTSIGYIDFSNLANYMEDLILSTGAENDQDPSEFLQALETYLGPFDYLFSENRKISSSQYVGKIELAYDQQQFLGIFDEIEEYIQETQAQIEEFQKQYEETQETRFLNIYTDVVSNTPNQDHIASLNSKEIMTGYPDGSFGPYRNINRAEFLKIVMGAQDYLGIFYTTVEPNTYFDDVPFGEWYTPYINKARAHNIVQGYADNQFKPGNSISRAEAATIILNLSSDLQQLAPTNTYSDVTTSDWYYEAASKLTTAGINFDDNNNFNPHQAITRHEAARLIDLYLQYSE